MLQVDDVLTRHYDPMRQRWEQTEPAQHELRAATRTLGQLNHDQPHDQISAPQ